MVVKCVEGQEGVMSVETGSSYNGGHRSGGAACGLTLKLQKEEWVLGKVREGKLGLGSVNRKVILFYHCTFNILTVGNFSHS